MTIKIIVELAQLQQVVYFHNKETNQTGLPLQEI